VTLDGTWTQKTTETDNTATIEMNGDCSALLTTAEWSATFRIEGTSLINDICDTDLDEIWCYAVYVPNGAIVWGNAHVWFPEGADNSWDSKYTIGEQGATSCVGDSRWVTITSIDGLEVCQQAASDMGMNFDNIAVGEGQWESLAAVCYYTEVTPYGSITTATMDKDWKQFKAWNDNTLRFICISTDPYALPGFFDLIHLVQNMQLLNALALVGVAGIIYGVVKALRSTKHEAYQVVPEL